MIHCRCLFFLGRVTKVPCTQDQEEIYKQLTKLETRIDFLCHACPCDWMLFHGNCYFFSKIKHTWEDSAIACKEVEAQLIVIESDEEQACLFTEDA
ncbi:mCG1048504 [Mus musculus]|nr:mCG1048504 [Mus musculus]